MALGVNPGVISLSFGGAAPALDAQGNLILDTATGEVVEDAPVLYQQTGNLRQAVSGHFVLESGGRVGFAVGAYDTSKPLIIDPVLSYATFLVGPSSYLGSNGNAIAVDSAGDAYVTGSTDNGSFPLANPAQGTFGGGNSDAFVTKLNASGTGIVYSTYLGGSSGDGGTGIAVDSSGNAFVTGSTSSTNFPTTAGAFQTTNSNSDGVAFVTELNTAGNGLIYSTYLGGTNGYDSASAIALQGDNAYVTGGAGSTNFPTTQGVVQPSTPYHNSDFLTEFNTTGTGVMYSTYISGYYNENVATALAVDVQGNAYVTGYTTAGVTTAGAFQTQGQGGTDAFVYKVNSTGTQYLYATLLGGASNDFGYGIAVDSAGDAYVTGLTASSGFPTTANCAANDFHQSSGFPLRSLCNQA